MAETSEKEVEKAIEELLKTAEDYLWRAKVNKSKDLQNFEVALALEYATKAKDKNKQLIHMKEFTIMPIEELTLCLMNSPGYGPLLLVERAVKK